MTRIEKILISLMLLQIQILFAQTDSLKISWDANQEPDMFEYRLYRAVNGLQNFQLLQTVPHPQTNTVDRNSILPGGLYAFTLMAVDSAGNQSDFSDTVAIGIPQISWTISEIPSLDTTVVPISSFITDPDNSISNLQLNISNPNNLIVQRQADNLLLIPDPYNYTGNAGFTLQVEDSAGFWDMTNISLNVIPAIVNHAPQITSNPVTEVTAGTGYQYQVTASDPDTGDVLTFSLPIKPAFLSINSSTGRISGVPAVADTGSHNVRVRVTDSGGLTDDQNYILTVSWQNQPPVISAIPDQSIAEGSQFSAITLDDY
ncbi:MAG: hypothetical protein EH225_06170, partial [Calditrichaeota bacterium]